MISVRDLAGAGALGWPRHRRSGLALAAMLVLATFGVLPAVAQQKKVPAPAAAPADKTPRQTIVAALSAACSQNIRQFSHYLLRTSRHTFETLPEARRKAMLKRFALTSMPGHPQPFLDTEGRMVVRCATPAETVIFRLGIAEVDQNVAFIPVTVAGGEKTNFGLVHQPGGWRLYSLGLLVINVPALVKQWEAAELAANENAAIGDLLTIEQGVKTYHEAFGRWPQMLKELGPAPPNEVSPEHAQILSAGLASGTTDGYRFRYRLVSNDKGVIEGFELGAVPETYGKTGRRSFFLGMKGKLHAADKQGAPATGDDPIIQPPSESPSQ